MKTFVRGEWLPVLAAVLLVTVALTGPTPPNAVPQLPAAVLRMAASPVVFLGEEPANGSLRGLLDPVLAIAVAYYDGLPNATVLRIDFHLDGMNLTSLGVFNDTAFTLPVGFALRDGPHLASFALVDSYGTVATHNWTFTVDTIAPILIVTSPVYPMVPVRAVAVQGTAFPAMMAASPVNVTVTALPSHLANWTFANTTTGAFGLLIPLSEGPNVLFVNATDRARNVASHIVTLVSDTTKPGLQILTPQNLSVSPTDIVRVAGLSEFGAYLTVNGFSAAIAPNGTWGVDLALPDGPNVIVVAAADPVGNVNYAAVVVIVDSDAPQVRLAAPLPSLTNRSSIDLSGYATDSMLITAVARCGSLLRTLTLDPATGHFHTVFAGLPDGAYSVQITAVDAAQRTTILGSLVVVDTTPPVVRVSLPPDGLETSQSTVRINGTVDDPNATVLLNDQVLRPDAAGRWDAMVALIQGANVIRVSAVDAAGNRAAALLRHVVYVSPYPGLANRTAANEKDIEALAAFARLSLAGIVVLAVAIELVLFMRTERKLRENRRILSAVVRAMRQKPKAPGP